MGSPKLKFLDDDCLQTMAVVKLVNINSLNLFIDRNFRYNLIHPIRTHGDDHCTTLDKLIHNETNLQSPFLAQILHLHQNSDMYILLLHGS